jgi:hypothetical protein
LIAPVWRRLLLAVLVAMVAGCGGASAGSSQPPERQPVRPDETVLQGRSVDDLSTATRGSCRRFIKDLRKRLASDMLAEQQRLTFQGHARVI